MKEGGMTLKNDIMVHVPGRGTHHYAAGEVLPDSMRRYLSDEQRALLGVPAKKPKHSPKRKRR